MIQSPLSTSYFFSWFRWLSSWNKGCEGNQIYLAYIYVLICIWTYEPYVDKERDTWSNLVPCTVSGRTGTLFGVLNGWVIWWKCCPEKLRVLWCSEAKSTCATQGRVGTETQQDDQSHWGNNAGPQVVEVAREEGKMGKLFWERNS